jgi:hypothetical protein
MSVPILGPMPDTTDLPSLTNLEPFGWIFTPGPLPPDAISWQSALSAADILPDGLYDTEVSIASGSYTEKGRYRLVEGERRVTLYSEHPVWVITIVPAADIDATGKKSEAERFSRHTLVDARTSQLITQFLRRNDPVESALLDLHPPLTTPELTLDEAVAAAISGEERVLNELPRTAEYGSRWRLIPGFVQVTDIWRVSFDTSDLPPLSPAAAPEVAWVVIVDDKAGHRWLSAALQDPTPPQGEEV